MYSQAIPGGNELEGQIQEKRLKSTDGGKKRGKQERTDSQRAQRMRILSIVFLRGKIWLSCIHAKKIRNV